MSGLYAVTRQALATGNFNWPGGSFSVLLVDAGYTPDYEAHTQLSDIPSGTRVAAPLVLASLTAVLGFCDAADIQFTTLASTDAISAVVIVQTASPQTLVALIDHGAGIGLAAHGGAVHVTWPQNGIFRP